MSCNSSFLSKIHFLKSSAYQIFFKFISGLKYPSVSLYIVFTILKIFINLLLNSNSFSLFNKLRSERFENLENSFSKE